MNSAILPVNVTINQINESIFNINEQKNIFEYDDTATTKCSTNASKLTTSTSETKQTTQNQRNKHVQTSTEQVN
jgi:hypothetical protein